MPNRQFIAVAGFAALAWLAVTAAGQPPAGQSPADTQSPATEQPQPEKAGTDADREFDPSEEIIEDLSVPFPVDI